MYLKERVTTAEKKQFLKSQDSEIRGLKTGTVFSGAQDSWGKPHQLGALLLITLATG